MKLLGLIGDHWLGLWHCRKYDRLRGRCKQCDEQWPCLHLRIIISRIRERTR